MSLTPPRRRLAGARIALPALACLLGITAPAAAQAPGDAYLDPTAARLHQAARAAWDRIDDTVVRYTALIRGRVVASLRTPLKDRTVFRAESAHRVFWDRDGDPLIQVLAHRVQTPAGVEVEDGDDWGFPGAFDPAGDRLLFGFGDQDRDYGEPGEDDFWFEHPLAEGATRSYRFRSGDTLTLTLPDGKRLQAVELQVIPREADVHRVSGSLWIEPGSGALVRAVYRLSRTLDVVRDIPDVREEDERGEFRYVPGFLKPWTLRLTMVAVDYGLWNFEVWLPRSLRAEGVVAAGVLEVPAAAELSYRVESVTTEDDLARERRGEATASVEERRFGSRAEAMAYLAGLAAREDGVRYAVRGGHAGEASYLVPEDPSRLATSPELPPPLWEDAPGFPTEDELSTLMDELADVPEPDAATTGAWAANWGFERPDLIRYNRVEGASVGARVQARVGSPVGPLSLSFEPFLALGDLSDAEDLDLTGRLQGVHESLRRKVAVGAYREVRPVSRRGRHLGLGNSLTSLLFGRDDGEYFRATGADLVVTPPTAQRESWRLRLYAERQRGLGVTTDFNLAHAFEEGWSFRPNVDADARNDLGAELVLSPWWGTDPLAPQAGAELYLQGAGGDTGYGRAALTLRGSAPFRILDAGFRVGAEVAGGRSWGRPPAQRRWYLGGPVTLRGYPAASLVGETFARARLGLQRTFPTVSVSMFGDAAWAGQAPGDFAAADALVSVGLGVGALDGLVRLDVARGLRAPRQTRWDFYLDAPF